MAAVGFVTLLKNFSVRKLLFGVALLALMIFLVICITYTLKHSPWFLLGALPFLLSVMVCYEGFIKASQTYFLDYISCAVSFGFALVYLRLYWDSNYSSQMDAQSDIAWISLIPIHFFAYFVSCCLGLVAYYVYTKCWSR